MRQYGRVWVVFRKELIDTLRDRRTLIAMVLVPVVLYPVLMVVLVEALRSEKGRRETERYHICVPDENHRRWLEGVLQREDRARAAEQAADRNATAAEGRPAVDDNARLSASLRADQVDIAVLGPGASLWERVKDKTFQLGVLVDPPPDPDAPFGGPNRIVQLIYADTEPLSEFLYARISRTLANESDRIVHDRLASMPQGESLLTPIRLSTLSTAGPDMQYAKILAAIVPFLLVIMTVTGAMYPAIDLTAGERERGTLETLAVSPVPTGQIVAGKFCVVITIAMFTTVLNLGSMAAMIHFTKLDQLTRASARGGEAEIVAIQQSIEQSTSGESHRALSQRDYLQQRRRLEATADRSVGAIVTAAPAVLLAMVPFAVLFSAIMLAACSFARTFKEAQNYMMPVMMGALLPAMVVSYMPSIRLEGALLVVPVANIVVLIRELFLGNYNVSAITVTLLSTCFYAVVAVSVAARLYGTEAVLFSDVGSYKTLIRRRFFKPRSHPSAAEALMLLAVIFPLHFYWQSSMLDPNSDRPQVLLVLAISQIAFFAGPALIIAWYLKINLRKAFSLRVPAPPHALGALLIAAGAPAVSFMIHRIQARLVDAPPAFDVFKQFEAILTNGPLWTTLLVIALLPAVCEELLFRGLLQSGLRSRLSHIKTMVAVGVIFGLFHIVLEKIPQVSLMGMLLAFVCLRSRSIFLAMAVHLAHNAIPVLAGSFEPLARLYALPTTDADVAAMATAPLLDLHSGLFLALFLVGLGLLARTPRPTSAG
ncbi:MAG: ABC transporter permease subunit/CPBP intramembrane protease [Phycisphaerae bacterium]